MRIAAHFTNPGRIAEQSIPLSRRYLLHPVFNAIHLDAHPEQQILHHTVQGITQCEPALQFPQQTGAQSVNFCHIDFRYSWNGQFKTHTATGSGFMLQATPQPRSKFLADGKPQSGAPI
jgi:hypothetical protein